MPENKRRILLVEDDAITAVSEKVMLEANGYSVLTAPNGRKAVDIALNRPIDLILMDLELGGDIDGHGAARKILEEKNIPILFLTAHIEREMVDKVRSITRYGYALKNSGDYVLLSSIEMVFELFEAHERTRNSEENYRRLVEDINDIIFSIDSDGYITYISPRVEPVSGYKPDEIIGHHFTDFTDGDDFNKSSNLISALDQESEYVSEFRRIKKNGEIAWIRTSLRPVFRNGIYSGATGMMSDITEKRKSDDMVEALLAEKESLLKEINCLYNLSQFSEKQPETVGSIFENALPGIPGGFFSPEAVSLRIVYNGTEFTSGNTVLSSSVIKSNIIVNGLTEGLIEAAYDNGYSFNGREKNFLNTVAERLGRMTELVIAKNELKTLEKEIIGISENERQKIGHEIHDSLGQILTGISFMLKTVKGNLNGGGEGLHKRISEISELVYDATMICRKITRGLPVHSIRQDNLVIAIDQLAINTRNIYQLNCEFVATGDLLLKDDFTSSQLYYIAQEAVNNAAKHSDAENIKISLDKRDGLISLSVYDDGKGRMENISGGLGLNIMKYRSNLVGGAFKAENHSERGFLVSVNVPV
ncbi:MAG TPA: PAS domain S-box protein [Spirochaetota bacterium]|nr:PAS domain S-box protein [Spirochaetota bacterium]HPJ34355.1 PAS domain S-box protein [Spirochaetota bacterium]